MGRKLASSFVQVLLISGLLLHSAFGNNDREDFRVVSGILRLATKYLFESLRVLALAHLGIAWPTTLRGWETREDRVQSYELDHPHRPRFYPHPFVSNLVIPLQLDLPDYFSLSSS